VDLDQVDPVELWPALADKQIVAHNAAFDLAILARLDFAAAKVIDTMIESQIVYAGDRIKHSLADCCKRELDIEIDKAAQTSDWSGELTPAQIEYAALDADLPRQLHAALNPKIKAAKLDAVLDLESRALPSMIWLSQSGVGFDRQAWQILAAEAGQEQAELKDALDATAPPRPQGEMFGQFRNWNSTEEVKSAFKLLGFEIANANDDTLAKLDHPLADLLRKYRSASKRVGTYGMAWLKHVDDEDRVYARWRQIGADSGRMSCSDPNLQQLPRDERYRRCFVAPPGRVLIKADYSQIELRLAAKIAGETTMIEAYRRGDDLHTLTAQKILGKADVSKADRQLAKSLNFGLLYGMGAANLRTYCRSTYGVQLTDGQAKEYRSAFFKSYPGLSKWHRKAGGNRDIVTRTICGRHRVKVGRFTEKLNTPVQGSGADGLKAALALLWERRAEHPTAIPVLAVHDEIVVEADELDADAVCIWLKAAMIDGMAAFAHPVPVEVEATIARTWGG
jgi:DNA polymerase-1